MRAINLRYYRWSPNRDEQLFVFQLLAIIQCKMPDFALIDASSNDLILAGRPFEMDKQGAKVLGLDWKEVEWLRMIEDSLSDSEEAEDS